jgi:hypothetical protein
VYVISRLRIIVTGLIAQHPLGGVTWDYLQYVLGLQRLGHDTYYIEDSGAWPYALDGGPTGHHFAVTDCSANIAYLASVMSRFGLDDRWAYRCPISNEWTGLSDAFRRDVIASADLLINISSTVVRPDEYRVIPRLVFIDSDPVFTQIKLARGQKDFRTVVDVHDVHLSFGECLANQVSATGHHWKATRQPVVLEEWHTNVPHRDVFSTVMNWASYNPVVHEGKTYGQKDIEFMRFIDLPARAAPSRLEVAIRSTRRRQLPSGLLTYLRYKGWNIVDPIEVCPDLDGYRNYIQRSMAEWSVAKNGYVEGKPGWFSCRSVCYLAAGRPIVVQDTGFAKTLPVGEGILSFNTIDEAADGIRRVKSDYQRHSKAACAIAEEYFGSDQVLEDLLEKAFATHEVIG